MTLQEQVRKQLAEAGRTFNPYTRSPQARGVFADPDEVAAHRWYLIQPPVAWFHDGGDVRRGARVDAFKWVERVEGSPAERRRVRSVAGWIRGTYGGDLNKALYENPLLAFYSFSDSMAADGLLVDGWHRLYIWMKRVSTVVGPPTLVGVAR